MPTNPESKSKQRGVPQAVKTLVAVDIQDAGGIHKFDKEHPHALDEILCNKVGERKTLFKPYRKGTDKRRQVTNLVQTWKDKFSTEEFLEKIVLPLVLEKQGNEQPVTASTASSDVDTRSFHQSPSTSQACRIPTNKKNLESDMKAKLGKKLIVPLPQGLIFCVVWVDSKLSNMKVFVSKDGLSVISRQKVPSPNNAADLLSHCAWATNEEHVVVSSVNGILDAIKANQKPGEQDVYTESEIVSLEEEVIRTFVDVKGKPTRNIGFNVDDDGRQIITFFLKTAVAHAATTPAEGKFCNNGPGGSYVGGGSGDEDEDNSMYGEETVEDVKADMDAKLDAVQSKMSEMFAQMFMQMQQQQQQQQAFQQHFQQQVQSAQQQQQMQSTQQQQQQGQQFQAVPDGAPSSMADL